MIKIKIYSIGKTKEAWLDEAFEEYLKRLQPWCQVECIWLKNDEQLIAAVLKESMVICLQQTGVEHDSSHFAQSLSQWVEKGGARLTFVIGGPEGLPLQILSNYPPSSYLSLSRMTFTHQITRLVLIEQIYRAFTILHGVPYNK
jgi:23S rRNA (pseudouridine1915-N3)-methyltransferase